MAATKKSPDRVETTTVGGRLALAMSIRGQTPQGLSGLVGGLTRPAIENILKNKSLKHGSGILNLKALAQALYVSADWLTHGTGSMEQRFKDLSYWEESEAEFLADTPSVVDSWMKAAREQTARGARTATVELVRRVYEDWVRTASDEAKSAADEVLAAEKAAVARGRRVGDELRRSGTRRARKTAN